MSDASSMPTGVSMKFKTTVNSLAAVASNNLKNNLKYNKQSNYFFVYDYDNKII